MSSFADSLLDLRYERGVVSFRLAAAAAPQEGVRVFIPFADAQHMTALLHAEMAKIAPIHRNWLTEQLACPPVEPDQPAPGPQRLGRRIGSSG